MTWDRNGNVTLIEDNIHGGLDVAYTNDNVNRLTKAEEGTWNGSSITSRTREQNWTLDQVGNWEVAKLDLDGDNNWNETGEYNDDRTHNVVNELTARDTDDNGTDNYTLTYDNVGNLTDDGEAYEYVYDAWGRLRKVLNTSTQALIEEFWYNGLGYRITFHADATGNGTTDGSDPKYHLIYDERWRLVATYRADDDNPKEAFVPHQAGLDGTGSSSYIDSVILRQRDANSGWTSAADGTMEERRNYCQNWRSDVSALLTSAGVMVEWGKFTAYGRGPQSRFFGIGVPLPIGLPAGDRGPQSRFDVIGVPFDSDFITDTGDVDAIKTWVAAYDVRADLDLDGDIDATDGTLAEGYEGWQLGWNELSHTSVANRLGYAGYHKDVNLDISHVRNRVLEPHLGRWTRRDPLGYVDGMNVYEYVASMPTTSDDPHGLFDPIRSHFPAPCPPQGPCIPIDPFRRPPPRPQMSPVSPWSPTPDDSVPVPHPSPVPRVPWPGGQWFDFDINFGYGGKCCFRSYGVLVCVGIKGGCQHGPCRCCPTEQMGMQTKCKICMSLTFGLWGSVGCKPDPDVGFSHDIPFRTPGCCDAPGECEGKGCISIKASAGGQSVSCDWCFGEPIKCKATLGRPKLKAPEVTVGGSGCITCTMETSCQRYYQT